MRYFVDINQKHADPITELINDGKYQNIQQFIVTAIENQLYIEKSDIQQQPMNYADQQNNDDDLKNGEIKFSGMDYLREVEKNPELLSPPNFYDLACSFKRGQELNEEYVWLWGQVNRVFPVKIGLRTLLSMFNNGHGVELDAFMEKATDVALNVGKYIRNHERDNNKIREAKVSAGLPIDSETKRSMLNNQKRRVKDINDFIKQEEYKSKNRYKSQFLASQRKDGKLEGAMTYLRFVNINEVDSGRLHIGLTKAGLKFAQLLNPIIDEMNYDKSLTEQEIDFYLNHITKEVKGESEAIKWLLRKLEAGVSEREKINYELSQDYMQHWECSPDFINTQRAGLMARAYELNLFNKEKEGLSVKYTISNRGKEFINKVG